MNTLPVIVIGAGGHAKVVVDTLRAAGKTLIGLTDSDPAQTGRFVLGIAVLGGDEALAAYAPEKVLLANGLGGTSSMSARAAVYNRLRARGYRFVAAVHPSAVIAPDTVIGHGAQVLAGAVLQPGVVVDEDAVVSTRASVDHDCHIGAHSLIAPGAVLCGGVQIGIGTLVGAGATVLQEVCIGCGCLVGAGAAVTCNVKGGQIVFGVPARARIL